MGYIRVMACSSNLAPVHLKFNRESTRYDFNIFKVRRILAYAIVELQTNIVIEAKIDSSREVTKRNFAVSKVTIGVIGKKTDAVKNIKPLKKVES